MGKKRFVNKVGSSDKGKHSRSLSKVPKRKIQKGIMFVEATHNNTKISFTETNGNVIMWATSGSLGFNSNRKRTPYAASQVSEVIAEKAQSIGVKELEFVVKGVGQGREAALRSFVNRGFEILSIKDKTPIPHNGVRRKKPRRV